jgi:predicted O-methyltransferase YrrM
MQRWNGYIPPGECSGQGLVKLLSHLEGPIKGVEIGCAEGSTSEWLLRSLPTLQWTGIDPYVDYVDWNTNHLHNLEAQYQAVDRRIMKAYPDRTTFLRMTSDDAAPLIADGSLDFVFIDGLHTYDQVKKDCQSYYPKVKAGGLFAGHDYTIIDGVHQAVNEFRDAVDPSIEIRVTEHDVWYWVKPGA